MSEKISLDSSDLSYKVQYAEEIICQRNFLHTKEVQSRMHSLVNVPTSEEYSPPKCTDG